MNIDRARELSSHLELPQLIGTAQQIQEAELIRAEKLEQVPFFESHWDLFLNELETRSLLDCSLLYLKQCDLAMFWIENSDLSFWQLLELF